YAAGIVTDHGLRLGIDPDATLISAAGRHQIADAIVSAWPGDLQTSSAVSTVTAAVADLAAQLGEHGVSERDAARRMETLAQLIEAKEEDPRARKPGTKAEGRVAGDSLSSRVQLVVMGSECSRRKHHT